MDLGKITDKAKEWAGKNPDKADDFVEKGEGFVNSKFGGHEQHVDTAGEKAKGFLHGDQAPEGEQPPPGEQPPRTLTDEHPEHTARWDHGPAGPSSFPGRPDLGSSAGVGVGVGVEADGQDDGVVAQRLDAQRLEQPVAQLLDREVGGLGGERVGDQLGALVGVHARRLDQPVGVQHEEVAGPAAHRRLVAMKVPGRPDERGEVAGEELHAPVRAA